MVPSGNPILQAGEEHRQDGDAEEGSGKAECAAALPLPDASALLWETAECCELATACL